MLVQRHPAVPGRVFHAPVLEQAHDRVAVPLGSGGDGTVIPGVYANGWIKRGPVGLIGATKSDAIETITCLLEDIEAGHLSPAPEREDDAILRLLDERGVEYTTWDGWMALDEHEKGLGAAAVDADGEPRARVKVVEREEMVRVSREGAPQPSHV